MLSIDNDDADNNNSLIAQFLGEPGKWLSEMAELKI